MSFNFNADEVFAIAERIEINGGRFYRAAAAAVEDPGARELMHELARMEDEHHGFFAELRARLSPRDGQPTTLDPEGEAAAYLQAFADGQIFDASADPSERFDGNESVIDILRTAIGFEKDAIVFFLAMRELVPVGLGQRKLDSIIKEEQRHILMLTRQLQAAQREEA